LKTNQNRKMKKAFITGIAGQDGSYLAELLISKGYEVDGLIQSSQNCENIAHLQNKINLVDGDLTDQTSLYKAIKTSQPDFIFNLAATTFVGTSWTQPMQTSDVTGLGCLRMLEAVKQYAPNAKFFQASSSEMFGNTTTQPQNESTPFKPRNPYAIAKVYAYWMTVNYRESYGLKTWNGILFNHESERRGLEFVSRKISHGVARIKLGLDKRITLGNLDAKRDWGYAPDYCEAMLLMLEKSEPDDFVIATGETHSVREFLDEAFKCVGINDWEPLVAIDDLYKRPVEVHNLWGDSSKAERLLGWKPKVKFKELVKIMVNADFSKLKENPNYMLDAHGTDAYQKDMKM